MKITNRKNITDDEIDELGDEKRKWRLNTKCNTENLYEKHHG